MATMRWAAALIVCAALANTVGAEPLLTLTRDGKPSAVIIVPDKPSAAAVAGSQLLSDMIFQMSGARLATVSEGKLAAKAASGRIEVAGEGAAETYLLVGEGDLARQLGATSKGLGPGGIRIKTCANALILLGPDAETPSDPWGTRYAVTMFLDETLGCKYLWPTETGLVVPPRKTVQTPALDVSFTPAIRQRSIRSMGYNDRLQKGISALAFTKEDFLRLREVKTPNWFGWHRMGGTLGLIVGDGTILPKEAWNRITQEHPEWMAMQADGSRVPAPNEGRPRLCKSNPALIEVIVQEKLKELKANPGRSSASLMTHDGGKTGFCLCPACKAMDPQEGRPVKIWTYNHATKATEWMEYVSLTDRMFTFYNIIAEQLAREYPEVLFTGQAYSVYSAPPLKTQLHPNIVIRFVGISYLSDKVRGQGLDDWNTWAKRVSKMYFRPNLLLAGRREGTPVIYVHKLAQDFNHLAGNGMIGTDFDSCAHNWATQGLNYYVLAKLHWNPALDVDKAIEEYCRAGFGAGWQQARAYLARVEQLTDRIAAEELETTVPYTPEVLTELRSCLDAVVKSAGDDEMVRRRVAFLRRGLDFTDLQSKVYRLVARTKDRDLTTEEKQEAGSIMDQRWRMMRKMFKEEPYAVNVAYVCWGERLGSLGWGGPSPKVRAEVEADEEGRPVE